MMNTIVRVLLLLLVMPAFIFGQTSSALQFFPKGTQLFRDIPYAEDTLQRHQLDIYLPSDKKSLHPIIFWIHSGGWRAGGKEGDMHYLPQTLHALMKNGYAIVATNYRFSTSAIFPAQIQDCNRAMEFVYAHAAAYQLDTSRIALMGFSAGGHLAALMGLSANNKVMAFSTGNRQLHFKISAVVDYFGLSDFHLMPPAEFKKTSNGPGLLFGAAMNDKPELVYQATPLNYIDANDPPFLILHGTKDVLMDVHQSTVLHDSLSRHGITNKLILVKGAPHGGEMFDSSPIRSSVIAFLNKYLHNDH